MVYFTANINKETNIRFGIILANNVSELVDTIVGGGTNISYEEYLTDVSDELECLAEDFPEPTKEKLFDYIDKFYPNSESSTFNETAFEEVLELIKQREFYEAATLLLDYGVLSYYSDEDDYEYLIGDEHYYLNSMYLWVMKSPKIVKARLCSPCFPNAGDLDNLDDEYGYDTYGVPEKYLEV
jgi:hypothetical protein